MAKTNTETRSEQAVRRYLAYLRDPSRVVDTDAVAKLEDQLASTEDPLERLQLRQQIHDLSAEGVGDQVEQDFIANAKWFCDQTELSAAALQAEGVPEDVLVRARLLPRRWTRAPERTCQTRRSPHETVCACVHQTHRPFTIFDLVDRTGVSPARVRAVVESMLEEGSIEDIGADEDHPNPWRPPRLYLAKTG